MKQVLRNERGMALALAIVAMVIVGALVAGALFSGTQEQRMAESSRFQQQSFGVRGHEGCLGTPFIPDWSPRRTHYRRATRSFGRLLSAQATVSSSSTCRAASASAAV